MAKKQCSERVFSGERWDFGGHACGTYATVERLGKWWCKRHDPEAVARRRAESALKAQVEKAEEEPIYAESAARAERLGGFPTFNMRTGRYTGGVTISPQQCDVLIAKLGL